MHVPSYGASRVQAPPGSASLRRVEVQKSKSRAGWLWALVPAFGLFELGLHVWQVQRALTAEDWDEVVRHLQQNGLNQAGIAVTPHWAEPAARRALGPLATFERFGVSDYSHYAYVWELHVDSAGASGSAFPKEWWECTHFEDALSFRVRRIHAVRLCNPHPEPMLSDLLALAERGGEENLSVLRGVPGAESPCTWKTGMPRVEADQEAWGLARGAHYVQCADNTRMSVQVVPDHNWRPRRCFSVPTTGPGARTRLMFHHVHFARIARMHDGLHGYEEDAQNKDAAIKLSLSVQAMVEDGKTAELKLGENTHRNGEVWKGFDIDTQVVPAGEVGDLIVDVESDSKDRKFCLEGSTR